MDETQNPQPLPLPPNLVIKKKLTYNVPHILKSITLDNNGFYHRDVREGGPRQIEFSTEVMWSETPVEEEFFAIRATNQVNFGGSIINVINDEITLQDYRLVPTEPTATQYLEKVGAKVMVGFVCKLDPGLTTQRGHSVYRIARIYINLP